MILLYGGSLLRTLIGHLSVRTIGLPRLCLNRSPLSPYDSHITFVDAPPNKIHLVLVILNSLDFFDYVKLI